MIGRITGILTDKNSTTICIDTNGVGYEIDISFRTLNSLPNVGELVTLFTHLVIRENEHLLFGFKNSREREIFRILIKITGIGTRTALSILTILSIEELIQAVMKKESIYLTSIPGIGKKTAERLIFELYGKLPSINDTETDILSSKSDILNALVSLGYSKKESLAALKMLPRNLDISESIRHALKLLIR